MTPPFQSLPPAMPGRPGVVEPRDRQRILTSAARELAATIDRQKTRGGNPGTAREIVTIFNGGSIPTTANSVFWGYPTTITAADVEGQAPTYTPDTTQPIPVIVLNQPAVAGDVLVAHATGNRWVAEKTGKAKKTVFCYYDCHGVGIAGATISLVDSDGNPAGQCTTSVGGCCLIDVRTSGTYTVTATAAGFPDYSQTFAITPGGTYYLDPFCCIQICLSCCGGAAAYPYGATVTVKNYFTNAPAGQCTTDATGCCSVRVLRSSLATTGDVTVSIEPNCSLYAATSGTYQNACAYPIKITVPYADPTAVCCSSLSCVPIKRGLALTDANGSHAFVLGAGGWTVTYQTPPVSPTMGTITYDPTTGACIYDHSTTTGPTCVTYYGSCSPDICGGIAYPTDGGDYFYVTRVWNWNGGDPPQYFPSVSSGQTDPCNGPCNGSLGTPCAAGWAPMPSSCEPFSISIASLATPPNPIPNLPDPVGGGVVIS